MSEEPETYDVMFRMRLGSSGHVEMNAKGANYEEALALLRYAADSFAKRTGPTDDDQGDDR